MAGRLAIFLLVSLAASPSAGGPRSGAAPVRNAILISIDSVRADHLPLYGYPRDTTPALRRLAETRGALVFRRATAISPACHPSHATLLAGLYPQQVGIPGCGEDLIVKGADLALDEDVDALTEIQQELRDKPLALARKKLSAVTNWLRIRDTTTTLATFLRRRGFRTGGFVSIWTIAGRFGYGHGFERFSDDMPEYYGPGKLAWLLRDYAGSQRRQVGSVTVDRALDYLAGVEPDQRFFLFLHLADTHVPYAPRTAPPFRESPDERRALEERWRRRYGPETRERAERVLREGRDGHLLDRYDAALRYADEQLGRLFDHLAARGLLDETLIVITADHGDSFGQHLYLSSTQSRRLFFEHSVYVWEETQHVPLVVFDPSVRSLSSRDANVSHVDVVPTVLARLGFDRSDFGAEPLPGRNLFEPGDGTRTVYFLTFGRGRPGILDRFQDYPKFIGFRTGDLKFFVDKDRFKNPERGRCFLYDLAEDPYELDNLCRPPEAGEDRQAHYRRLLVDWYERTVRHRAEPPPEWRR